MKKEWSWLRDALLTLALVGAAFVCGLLVKRVLGADTLIPMVFILAVFLTALLTHGYVFGILASLGSVMAVNYAFAFPYFEFDFLRTENMVSALLMLTVALIASALTTRIRRQEKQRAESEREFMRANLLRAISHDLRTPLTGIYGSTTAIMENYDALPKAQQMELLGGMKKDAQWLIRMVENLLSVTRVGGGGVELVKMPVVVEELAENVLEKFYKYHPAQPVRLEIPEEFVRVDMDALLIEQVLLNLLENAVQHAQGMTALWLRVRLEGGQALFEVADDGCGIPKEAMAGLFTGQGPRRGPSPGDGRRSLGIGLSVCATIVRAHGGVIAARERPGGGACFCFALPMREDTDE